MTVHSMDRSVRARRMRPIKVFVWVLCFYLAQMLAPMAQGWAQATLQLPNTVYEYVETVGPGVEHFFITANRPAQHQAIHVLRLAWPSPYSYIRTVLGKGTISGAETLTGQVARVSSLSAMPVGGVNGDFFLFSPVAGVPFGMQVEEGEFVISPNTWPSFAVDAAGRPFIGYASFAAEAIVYDIAGAERGRIKLSAVNRLRGAHDDILYTPRFGLSTRTSAAGTEVVLSGSANPLQMNVTYTTQVQAVYSSAGDTSIPLSGLVLSVAGAGRALAESLQPGERVDLKITVEAPFDQAKNAITGNKLLVAGNKVALSATDAADKERHPRTAVGYNEQFIYLVTVDGRQAGYADGMSYTELAALMLSLKAQAAINLDGGGSTTFAVRPAGEFAVRVANKPSEGSERAVGNGLVVMSTAPASELATPVAPVVASVVAPVVAPVGAVADASVGSPTRLWLNPSTAWVVPGKQVAFTALGQDEWYNPLRIAASDLTWSVFGAGDEAGAVGEAGAAGGAGAAGEAGNIGTIGTVSSTGVFSANSLGWGWVEAAWGPYKALAQVMVDDSLQVIHDFEGIMPWRESAVKAQADVRLSSWPEPLYAGKHALRLDYDLTVGPAGTAAAYAQAEPTIPIVGTPIKVGLWVYGDGQGHWLRGSYIDNAGVRRVLDFTTVHGLDWIGWRYVEAEINPASIAPIHFEQIYVAEIDQAKRGRGTLYFDNLRVDYAPVAAAVGAVKAGVKAEVDVKAEVEVKVEAEVK